MATLEDLLNDEPQKWISALDGYQNEVVTGLLKTNGNPLNAAEKWLSPGMSNTFAFGSQKPGTIFLDNVKKEILKYLCGDPKYDGERKKLFENTEMVQRYVIGTLSVAIAGTLGSSAVFLAPVVALVLFSFGKCTLNAVCATFNENERNEKP